MPEFLAIHLSDAALLGCALRSAAARVQLGGGSAAGVGFFQSDDVLLRKRPLPAGHPAVPEQLAEGIESDAALICAGELQLPAHGPRAYHESSTLPFRFRRWLFAFAGDPDGLDAARAALLTSVPDFLRRASRGDSAAEALVLLFLTRLRDLGRIDDPDLDAVTAARALAASVGDAERALEAQEIARPPLAIAATNGRVLIGLRRGHPLWLQSLDGIDTCPRHEVMPKMNPHHPLARSHGALHAKVLVSGGAGQNFSAEGYAEVPDGGLVAIERDLSLRTI